MIINPRRIKIESFVFGLRKITIDTSTKSKELLQLKRYDSETQITNYFNKSYDIILVLLLVK